MTVANSLYPRVAALLAAGSSFASRSAAVDHDDDDDVEVIAPPRHARQPVIQRGASIDTAQLDAEITSLEIAAATSATTAANTRWADVMASAEGIANPAAAAKMLSKTDMAASDVIETLKDLGTGAPAAGAGANSGREQQREEQQARLNSSALNPATGAAASEGGGDVNREKARERRKAMSESRNKQAQAAADRNRARA